MSQCPSKPNVPLVPLIGPEDEEAETRLFPTVEDADKFPAKIISGGYRLVEKL